MIMMALPSYGQVLFPRLTTLARCSNVTDLYISDEEWQVAEHESCFPTAYGGRYIYHTASKGRRLIVWISQGGNRVRDYTVASINLEDFSCIEYEASLGIRGEGFVNSLVVTYRYGNNVIPIANILSVLVWERGFYEDFEVAGSLIPQSQQTFSTGTLVTQTGSRINLRDWPGINAPIRHQASTGDAVTVWENRTVGAYVWYRVTLESSNVSGWVRSDVIRIHL